MAGRLDKCLVELKVALLADWKVVEKAVLTETCLDLDLDARLGFCLAEYLVEMWGAGLD